MKACAAAALAGLLVTGCAQSVAELRESSPHATTTVAGDYRALAGCAADAFDAVTRDYAIRVIDRAGQRTASVLATFAGGGGLIPMTPIPMFDVAFEQVGPADVAVATRIQAHAIELGRRRLQAAVDRVVAGCAAEAQRAPR